MGCMSSYIRARVVEHGHSADLKDLKSSDISIIDQLLSHPWWVYFPAEGITADLRS